MGVDVSTEVVNVGSVIEGVVGANDVVDGTDEVPSVVESDGDANGDESGGGVLL